MMEHFVTIFDALFLPQGLALHASMERHVRNYTLWILCVDSDAYKVLKKIDLSNVRLLNLSELETKELLSVKPKRSRGEYCWTLTPFAPRFVFEKDLSVDRVTYIDADTWFRKHPSPIFDEFEASNKSVLITDHAYAPEYDQSSTSGQYCVQFVIFTRKGGEVVRKWWEEKCIEWCYSRMEDGKFGDQKYLDDWPIMFKGQVHILQNKESVLAPWNATRYPYGNSIIWHFHGFRVINKGLFNRYNYYKIGRLTRINIYSKYIKDVKRAISILEILDKRMPCFKQVSLFVYLRRKVYFFVINFRDLFL
jgi:hypothetical protein